MAKREYLDKKNLADYLGVSPNTIDNWRRSGGFPYIKLKGKRKVIFERGEVDRYLDSLRMGIER